MRTGYKVHLGLVAGGFILAAVIGFLSIYFFKWEAEAPIPIKSERSEHSGQPKPKKGETLPASAAPQSEQPLGAVDRVLEKMEIGNAAFNVPSAMNLDDTSSVQLMLSLITPIEELKNLIEADGLKEGVRIRVSDRMEARLSGPNFSITGVTDEVQAVSHLSATEWRWDIKPVEEGKQILHLTLSALIIVDGASTPRAIRTFDKIIEVEVTWGQKVSLFIEKNWQWLWAAVLVPVGGWLWKRRKTYDPHGAPENR